MSPSALFHITFKMRGEKKIKLKIGFLLVLPFQTFSNHCLISSLLVSDCQNPKQAITLPYNTNVSFQIYSISKSLDDVNLLFWDMRGENMNRRLNWFYSIHQKIILLKKEKTTKTNKQTTRMTNRRKLIICFTKKLCYSTYYSAYIK